MKFISNDYFNQNNQYFQPNYFYNQNIPNNQQQNFYNNNKNNFQFNNQQQNNNIYQYNNGLTSPYGNNYINQQNQPINQQQYQVNQPFYHQEKQNYLQQNNIQYQQNDKEEIKLFHDYQIYLKHKLGSGSYGTVYLCKYNKDQKFYACKMVLIGNYNDVLQEMHVAQEVKGKYICELYFAGMSSNYLYLIAEYCPQGTLKKYIQEKKPSLQRIMIIFCQIVKGYYTSLYIENIIHRDIKLDNILMKDDIPKICDFGFGKFLDDVELSIYQSKKCSPLYGAPQITHKAESKYSYKADIYSLGVLLYQMTNDLKNPNQMQNAQDLLNFHTSNQINGIEKTLKFYPSTLNQNIKNLIYRMMKYNEADRISIEELVEMTQLICKNYQNQSLKQI
ncbi:protein kinase (macronuclear) [Tetrahymena thermophila SB210]|uniref:Protein kinase n=1 Tax=Tetrahymena thermophila (strain SB210) TaxID=312017 RepID=Q22S84_TETTS|nr:protein kinase [Tetrahymena thermophila SB210]EAR87888.1 protein kinase [Tetrahymena thermophila SB210]|eukprot:XP_001008133.1 protein kinase [Tetrahymena thermophila SB210]